jgi:hypothetical protein
MKSPWNSCNISFITTFVLSLSAIASAQSTRPSMRDFIGINGHTVQFRPKLYAPVCSLVRDYHPVVWDLDPPTNQLPPFPQAKNGVDWNEVYSSWGKEGFRSDVCLMFDSIEPAKWHDLPNDAAAYVAAFASHFGPSSKTPLVESLEIGNEPGNFSDQQYESLLSAAAPAARKADPRLKIATCNLTTGPSGKYDKSVTTLLADPAVLPAIDILNIHTYAQAEPYPTWRRSYPEDPKLKYLTDVTTLARWRVEHAPGKAIWITEFGYDCTTKKPDPKSDFARWVGVSDLQQAQYLVRSILVFSALPVERAYIYYFDDNDEPHMHGSSGITRNFQPKPSFYALKHLQSTLGAYHFDKVVQQKTGEVYAYEFARAGSDSDRIIVAWSPTGGGRSTTAKIELPAGYRIVRAERMPTGQDPPVEVANPVANALPISESPLYLFLEQFSG